MPILHRWGHPPHLAPHHHPSVPYLEAKVVTSLRCDTRDALHRLLLQLLQLGPRALLALRRPIALLSTAAQLFLEDHRQRAVGLVLRALLRGLPERDGLGGVVVGLPSKRQHADAKLLRQAGGQLAARQVPPVLQLVPSREAVELGPRAREGRLSQVRPGRRERRVEDAERLRAHRQVDVGVEEPAFRTTWCANERRPPAGASTAWARNTHDQTGSPC